MVYSKMIPYSIGKLLPQRMLYGSVSNHRNLRKDS